MKSCLLQSMHFLSYTDSSSNAGILKILFANSQNTFTIQQVSGITCNQMKTYYICLV
jgi:hypothetical protein